METATGRPPGVADRGDRSPPSHQLTSQLPRLRRRTVEPVNPRRPERRRTNRRANMTATDQPTTDQSTTDQSASDRPVDNGRQPRGTAHSLRPLTPNWMSRLPGGHRYSVDGRGRRGRASAVRGGLRRGETIGESHRPRQRVDGEGAHHPARRPQRARCLRVRRSARAFGQQPLDERVRAHRGEQPAGQPGRSMPRR